MTHSLQRRLVSVISVLIVLAALGVVLAAPAQALVCQNRSFALKSLANGRYVAAEIGGTLPYVGDWYGMLRARSTSIGAWERFRMECLGGYEFAIRAANGQYVSVELGPHPPGALVDGLLRARPWQQTIGSWERFSSGGSDRSGSLVSVARNKYISAELGFSQSDPGYGALRARPNQTWPGPWELFEVTWL